MQSGNFHDQGMNQLNWLAPLEPLARSKGWFVLPVSRRDLYSWFDVTIPVQVTGTWSIAGAPDGGLSPVMAGHPYGVSPERSRWERTRQRVEQNLAPARPGVKVSPHDSQGRGTQLGPHRLALQVAVARGSVTVMTPGRATLRRLRRACFVGQSRSAVNRDPLRLVHGQPRK